ncbi:MAG: restriction endonuclease subunit S [Pseudomonadota bacterium]
MTDNKKTIEPTIVSVEEVGQAATEQEASPDYAALIQELTLPKGWSVPLADVVAQNQVRLDAEHYDPAVIENNERLEKLGFNLVPLTDYADVHLPSMFTRIWAQDARYGVPYLNATDLMSYFALGVPAQTRFLSHASQVRIDNLIIRQGMILITCSGTIGRVFDVPEALDGWAGTHDIVRIIPRNPEIRGFLRAYLTTNLAQIQILSHTHGGQIDHVTDAQVGSCLVPAIPEEAAKRISDIADRADAMRAQGLELMESATNELHRALSDV